MAAFSKHCHHLTLFIFISSVITSIESFNGISIRKAFIITHYLLLIIKKTKQKQYRNNC